MHQLIDGFFQHLGEKIKQSFYTYIDQFSNQNASARGNTEILLARVTWKLWGNNLNVTYPWNLTCHDMKIYEKGEYLKVQKHPWNFSLLSPYIKTKLWIFILSFRVGEGLQGRTPFLNVMSSTGHCPLRRPWIIIPPRNLIGGTVDGWHPASVNR